MLGDRFGEETLGAREKPFPGAEFSERASKALYAREWELHPADAGMLAQQIQELRRLPGHKPDNPAGVGRKCCDSAAGCFDRVDDRAARLRQHRDGSGFRPAVDGKRGGGGRERVPVLPRMASAVRAS